MQSRLGIFGYDWWLPAGRRCEGATLGTFTFAFAGVEIELLEESHVSGQGRVLNLLI